MKLSGGKWSKGDFLTLIGVIAALAAIPVLPKLIKPDFEPGGNAAFARASADDLDPHSTTCLDEPAQVIPAGVSVCATMHGSWTARGPRGAVDQGATAIWARQAHPPFLVLSSPRIYQHEAWFQESIDYVVCVEPLEGAERTRDVADRMKIEIVPRPSSACTGSSGRP